MQLLAPISPWLSCKCPFALAWGIMVLNKCTVLEVHVIAKYSKALQGLVFKIVRLGSHIALLIRYVMSNVCHIFGPQGPLQVYCSAVATNPVSPVSTGPLVSSPMACLVSAIAQ